VPQRHAAFTLLLDPLSLHADDAADLIRRGFTADQISLMGAKTFHQGLRFNDAPLGLPGFSRRRFTGATGYVVPIHNWEGQIVGAQIRPRGGKYTWLHGCKLPCGEMPLQILKGDPSKPVFWIEGTAAKPWMVHLQTGATVIGIAGGCFNSPIQIAEILRNTAAQPQVLLPDGDAISNRHVLTSYGKLAALVPNLHVRWWDQFYKGSDADEVTADRWQNGTDIPFTTFSDDLSRLQAEGLTFHFNREPDLQLSQRYLPRDLLVRHRSKLDIVISGLGTGKTEALNAVREAAEATDQPV
jgi:hypothetical protein